MKVSRIVASHIVVRILQVAANASCTVLEVVDARDVELALEGAQDLLRRLEKLLITAFFPDTISEHLVLLYRVLFGS